MDTSTLPKNLPEDPPSWVTPGEKFRVAHSFEDWQGLVSGLAISGNTGQAAILQLLAWRGPRLEDRIFSIGTLPSQATDIFIRNMQSAYCDVTRVSHEVEALMSLREIRHIGRFQMPEGLCLAISPIQAPISHPDWKNLTASSPKSTVWWKKFN